MTRLEELQLLDHKVLQDFLSTGKSEGIADALQDYIRKINALSGVGGKE